MSEDLLIITVIMLGCALIAWILVKHIGQASRDSQNARLEAENGALKEDMARLLDRVAVLEKIATDPAARTAAEIEALRASPPSDRLPPR